jgi:muramoyltetrapeptide carboxypeptidase
MLKPPQLNKGDKVAIIATARKVALADLQPAKQLLESWGFQPVIGTSIGLEQNQFAGSDQVRAADLQAQINNPEIKAIWCAKGGYGSVRILDLVDFSLLLTQPKWLIGYSDVTAIHAHLTRLGIMSMHGQMAVGVDQKSAESIRSLEQLLKGKELTYTFKPSYFNRKGKATGKLIGGNLSVIYSLCGSNSALITENSILVLEDLDEYLYHIDRMMQNLKRNGYFNQLNALIIGGMTEMNDNSIPFGQSAEEIITETIAEFNFPVCFNFPCGHIINNQTFIHGHLVSVEVTESASKISYL